MNRRGISRVPALLWLLAVIGVLPASASSGSGSATGRVAEGAVPQPVAVMPFRNLNEDPDLQWLSVGMSETMLSDLRREGTRIVDRDALDTALAEMALQGVRPTDESTAARVGQLVGAKTMVFGGYQTAGGQIRITARFVEVETSVVLDAAMATGPIGDILALQDEIVSKLIGRPLSQRVAVAAAEPTRSGRRDRPAAAKATPPTKASGQRARRDAAAQASRTPAATPQPTGPDAVEAYRRFSMSLTASSAEERRRLLEEALDLSPGFAYAREQLEALERRLQALAEARKHAQAAAHRDTLNDASSQPWERWAAAVSLVSYYFGESMLLTVMSELDWIESLDWPDEQRAPLRSFAAVFRMNVMQRTGQLARAIEYGQAVRETYPESSDDREVLRQIESIESRLLDLTRRQLDRLAKLEELDEALERFPPAYERLQGVVERRTQELAERIERRDAAVAALEAATDDAERARLERDVTRFEDSLGGSRNLFRAAWDNLRREQVRECRVMHQHFAHRRAATLCLERAAQFREDGHPNFEVHEDLAISIAIDALTALGAYDEATELVALYEADPERTYYRSVRSTIQQWPAEVRPDLPEPPR